MTNNDDDLGGSAPDFSSFGSPIETPTPDAAPEPAPRRSAFAWAPDVDDALETAAKEHGVERSLLDTFARIESSGRANAQTGSYKGLFQLSDTEFRKHGGQSNPFDPYENARAGAAKLRAEKADFAKRYGRDPTATELYMIHQQGVGGAAAHMANPDAPAWQNMYSTGEGRQKGANWARRAIWGNVPDDMKRQFGSVDNLTSRDFVKMWENKVARFGGGSTASAALPAASGLAPTAPAASPGAIPDLGNLVASKQPGSPSPGKMSLGGPVSEDDDEETADQDTPLFSTSYDDVEDDEAGADPETDNDGAPMYLGGPSEDKPDFSKFGTPLGKAATPAGSSAPDFSKFGKPVAAKPAAKDGGGFWDNAAEIANPEQYKSFVKRVIPGAISMQGTALQMPDAAVSGVQHRTIERAKQQLAVMDRIDAGEKVEDFQAKGPRANWDTDDYFGYQQMTPEQRATQRGRLEKEVAEFNPTPIQDRYLYKKGEEVQEYAKNLFPAAPGYENSVGAKLGEGLGSMVGGMPYGFLGRVPAGLFFGAAGAGEATQRAVEFDKKERKEGREGLTQEQIALAGIAGIAPGTTDLLPLETLMGRLPIPIPEAAKKPLAQAIARIGGQAFIEGLQEGGQQFLQNLIAREVYNPKQELGDEVLGNAGIGAGVGGIAQTGKEVGSGLVKLAGGRRGRHAGSAPEAGEDEEQKALPAPPKQITGPQGEQPAQENLPPPASAEEAGWLRAQGWDDKTIAEMSPDQRAAEIEEAKAQGLKPVAGPAIAPDNPSAEPVGDLLAQAADLNDPKNDRSAVYVPKSSLDALDEKSTEKLAQAMGDNLVLQNFDDKGGHLVVADYETAKAALEAKAAGEDLQKIIGQATGAGSGKPVNGSIVVQQRDKAGNVTRESLVTPDKVDATKKAFAKAGRDVEVLSPQEALQRREEMIAQQSSKGQGTRNSPVRVETARDVAAAGQRVAEPTDAQRESGNYKKGHLNYQGLQISIETPKGAMRRGDGWEVVSPAAYGYFKGVPARAGDKEHVDVYIGDNVQSDTAFIVDQHDLKTGRFDEPKVILGARSAADAASIYDAGFSDGKGPERRRAVSQVSIDQLKDWLDNGDATKPFARKGEARSTRDAGVQDLAERGGPLSKSEQSLLPQLRGTGDQAASGVGEQLRGVSGGRGQEAGSVYDARSQGQREGVRAGQRALGDQEGAGAQYAQEPDANAQRQDADPDRVGGRDRAGSVDTSVSSEAGRDDRGRSAERAEESRQKAKWDGPELSEEDIHLIVANWKFVRDVNAMPKPESLAQFVISSGGLRDDAREVRHIMGAAKERPGLVNKDGITLDDMALKAWESGFFEDSERPTIADFLNKLQDDLHTGTEVRLIDQDALDSIKMAGEIAEELNDYGITASSFRSEASLREYFGQARAKAARPAEDAEGTQATGREGAGRTGDSVDEVPFGSEPEAGRQDAVARDEARDDERAGAVRDREDQDQQGAEPATGARDSGEDRGPAGARQAGRGSDLEGARETGPSDSRGADQLADYSDQQIDGWNEDGQQKHRFLTDARNYLTKVAKILKAEGFEAFPDKKGKAGKPVNVNQAGPAVSGDVSLNLIDADGFGVYAQVSGEYGGGVNVMARRAHKGDQYGSTSDNQWLGDALTAQELAEKLLDIARPPRAPAAITTEKSGQTSLVPEPTTKEKIAAEARAKARKGGNEVMDEGLFGSEKDQTDLVDMAKAEPKSTGVVETDGKLQIYKGSSGTYQLWDDTSLLSNHKSLEEAQAALQKAKPKKKADPFKGEMPDEPDFDFIPNQGWRDHLFRARVYATALRIDHRGKSLEELVQAIDDATTAHAGVPDGVKVWMSDSTLDPEEARMKGGEWHAYAQREKPYSVVDGYGDTPEAAMRNAVENLKPAKPSRLGQGLGDLMGKSGGQAKAVETVVAGAKAPEETATTEVSEDVAAALERGKAKARAHVLRLGRQNGTEFGMIVLKDGSTKANKVSGSETVLRVDFETAPELWTEPPRSADFHHNHPKSSSFSRADYTDAAPRPSLRRTWVHGHDGSEYWAEFKADGDTLGKAYDIARAVTETVTDKSLMMHRYRGHIIAQMMKQGGVIDYYADMTPADAEERIEAIRAAIGEEKIADAIEDIANLKETADGLLDRGTGSAGRRLEDVAAAPDQAAEAAAEPARGAVGDAVRPAEDQAEAARGDDQDALDLTPEEALQERLIDKGFKTIVEARKFAAGLGITGSNKQIDETIEKAVVQAARSIVLNSLTSDITGQANQRETFDALLALYENQPNLSSRTGTSVANQAYSTPVPLAFVASRLAGVVGADHVLEPTAGNGALLIEAGQGTNDEVFANELDPSRAEALREQGFNVKSEDATDADLAKPKSADAVIMNPPFGAVKDGGKSKVFEVGGWETTQIDHAIALNALEAMTDEGKAVLILGGTKSESTDERRKDYRGKAKREFYARLYKDYNVTDHFTVSGDLYTKQGASWPVDVIVIDGRGQSERKLPAAQPPEILKTWDQVAEKLPNATSAGRNELAARPVDRQAGKSAVAGAEPAGRDAVDRKAPVGRGSERVQPEGEGKPAAVRTERAQGEPADVGSRGRNDAAKPAGNRDGGRADQPAAAQPVRSRVKREAPKGGQAFYEPTSTAASLDTLIPVNMASAAREAMAKVEERRGSVDELVADRLGYDAKELSQYFSAEQVDALAAAIDNVERGAAFIIGDQTGIGKGRIAAGMLRYAMKKGMVPVFLTEKPDLYGDIFRDLRDIGVPEMLGREPRMFITNAGETITLDEEALSWKQESEEARRNGEPAPKKRGKFLVGGTAAKVQENMRKIASGDDIADVVFTTYDQLNTVKGATTPRRTFLSQIAPRAMIVMDEAHNAGGQVKTGWEKKDAVMNRADFARELAAKAKGVMFSSATYAKRPDVMDLYARTDMGKAVDDPKELGELIQRGGVPMQQIVASMLSKAGQYLRRERSFDGVDYQLTPVPVDLKAYKQFSASMQAIFRFDLAVEEFRDEWGQDKLDELGWKKSRDDGVGGGSASSVAFGSLMHNITNQMLLAIKAEQTAKQAIQAHKAGEKPVIALANTNESFIKDFAESEDIKIGQALDLDFSAVLERYLERTLRITVKGPDNEKKHLQIPKDALPLSLRQEFQAAMNAIKEGDYSSLPISPIDWIRFRLGEAGMSVKEVTGRQTMIDYSKPVPTYVQRPKSEQGASGKRGSISYFNAGKLDALILNRSGSTGVSMHASSSFKDQRRRRMILAQAEGNIDTHLQMLGRVHRTGQVIPPAYAQIAAEIPAEARPTAVLMKKMASLNANTTGARSSAFTVDSVDFINEVGDKVVADVLMEDPDLNEQLGEPLKFEENGKAKIEEISRKATGRLVLLDPEVQSRFLDQVQKAYLAEIEQLDALGENPLEAKTVDLQAKTLDSTELKPTQGDSPFLDAVRVEKVSAKAQGRAMAPAEVAEKIAEAIKTSKPSGSDAQMLASLESQGRNWGYKETDRVSALIRKQMAEEIAETGADAKESTRRRLETQFQRWNETMGLVYPGARVRLGMQAGDLDAVVMSVERTGKAKQMGALSAWTVKMAVPDSMRQLEFPMSKLFPPGTTKAEDEKGATLTRGATSHNDLVDAFEQARKEGRETRFILTGNILGGFDQTRGRGRIVNFTNDKGELRPGILMSREFNAEKFIDNRAVRFQNAGQIVEFMGKAPLAKVEASKGDIELSQFRNTFRIEMAGARAKGGVFYTDAAVRKAIAPIEFQKRGNKMIADDLSQSQFVKAVAEMQKIGAKFEVRDQQDLAQSIVAKRTGFEEDAGTEYRTNKDGFEHRLPFKEKWGDPRYNPTDRENALDRLREIQTMPVRETSWEELAQARTDINEITANLFFYRPDMSDEEVRRYDEVFFYINDPKGNLKNPIPSFFRDKMSDERSADLRDFQVQGKQALDHLLAARRSGLREMLLWGADSDLWTKPRERKGVDPSTVGEKMRSGFYFSAARKLSEAPDTLFQMNGQAVINWLLKKGVSRDEINHFGLQEKFGQQANDPRPRKFTREEFQKQIADRMFDFRRKVSWLNPERSKNDYDFGGTRAFRGPRIPGRGIYFERLMAFPKKLKGGEAFPPGDFVSPHWDEEMKNAWASWRGSVREVPGYGKMVVGEEGQTDYMQGANTGKRPRVSGADWLRMKEERAKYDRINSKALYIARDLRYLLPENEGVEVLRKIVPYQSRQEMHRADWLHEIQTLRDSIKQRVANHYENAPHDMWDAKREVKINNILIKLMELRAENEELFAPGASKKFDVDTDDRAGQFTPESPLDQRYVRTMLRDLLLHAAAEKADSIAISTTDTNDRIQINTYTTAGHFYDAQLAPRLERELRVLTGDYSLTLEKVALPKAQGHPRNEKAYTVWAAKLPAEVWEKIRAEGLPVMAVNPLPSGDFKSAIPDIRQAMGSVLKAGRPVAVKQEIVDAVHAAVGSASRMVPQGTRVFALTRVEPTGEGDRVIATFEDREGYETKIKFPWLALSGIRAFHLNGHIHIIRLNARSLRAAGEFDSHVTAELGHEVIHALRRGDVLVGDTWGRLLAHAKSLRLLDGDFDTYAKTVGDLSAGKLEDVTVREVYKQQYTANYQQLKKFDPAAADAMIQEVMNQEEVAHLMEWYLRGILSPAEVAPVRDILDAIERGEVAEISQESRLEAEMAFAISQAGQAQRRELDRLGFYSKALEAAKGLRQAKGTPEQMRAMLRTAGVKEAEIAATKLDGFLEGKTSVTKDEIVDFLRENRVEVKEGTYAGTESNPRLRRTAEWSSDVVHQYEILDLDSDRTFSIKINLENDTLTVQEDSGKSVDVGDGTTYEEAIDAIRMHLEENNPRLGKSGPAKWERYSIDPSNPTYRETVIYASPAFTRVDMQPMSPFGPRGEGEAMWAGRKLVSGVEEAHFDIGNQWGRITHWPETFDWKDRPAGEAFVVNSPNFQNARFSSLEEAVAGIEASYNGVSINDAMGKAREDVFRDLHWRETPNPIGHIRSQIIIGQDGKKYLNADNIQSAWQQAYRDSVRNGVARRLFNADFQSLSPDEKAAASKEIARMRKAGEPLQGVRDETKIADLTAKLEAAKEDANRRFEEAKAFVEGNRRMAEIANAKLSLSYEQVPFGLYGDLYGLSRSASDEGVRARAKQVHEALTDAESIERRLRAELQTAEKNDRVPEHPLIEVTDTNLNFMLKNFLRQAIEAGVDGISITPGHILSSRGEGDDNPAAMARWMDETVPRALRDLLRTYDKSVGDHVDQAMTSPVDDRRLTYRDEARVLRPHQEPDIQFHTFPLTDKVKETVMEDGQPMFAINGWHGSRHHIHRFDLRHIGTGEGAQAFGWGLYFAEAEGVAKHYRKAGLKNLPRVGTDTEVIVDKHGGDVDAAWRDVVEQMRSEPKYHWESYSKDFPKRDNYFATEQEAMNDAETQLEKMLSPKMVSGNMFGKRYWRQRNINSYKDWKVRREVSDNTIKFIGTTPKSKYSQRVDVVLGGISRSTRPEWRALDRVKQELEDWDSYYHGGVEGNLYQVKLNVEKEELLDWFIPLKDQPEHLMTIRRFIANNKPKEVRTWGWRRKQKADDRARLAQTLERMRANGSLEEFSGAQIYGRIAYGLEPEEARSSFVHYNGTGAQKAASELLHSIGIKGIRFNDQMSRFTAKYLIDGVPPQTQADVLAMDLAEKAIAEAGGDIEAGAKWFKDNVLPSARVGGEAAKSIYRAQALFEGGRIKLNDKPRTDNIVIFDDRDVEITHKNGQPLTAEEKADYVEEMHQEQGTSYPAFDDQGNMMFSLIGRARDRVIGTVLDARNPEGRGIIGDGKWVTKKYPYAKGTYDAFMVGGNEVGIVSRTESEPNAPFVAMFGRMPGLRRNFEPRRFATREAAMSWLSQAYREFVTQSKSDYLAKQSGSASTFGGRAGALPSWVSANDRFPKISPEQQAAVSKDITEAINIVNRIAGREVEVRFQETMAPLAGSTEVPLGAYQRPRLNAGAIITLATSNDDLLTTAGHEAWHHAETVLATDAERNLLSAPTEMRRMRAQAADEIGMDVADPRLAQIPDSEIRAIAFQKYRREREEGQQPQGIHIGIRRFWDRMLKILAVVRNALDGHGLTSYEDVFEAARTGEIAQRPAKSPSPNASSRGNLRDDEILALLKEAANGIPARSDDADRSSSLRSTPDAEGRGPAAGRPDAGTELGGREGTAGPGYELGGALRAKAIDRYLSERLTPEAIAAREREQGWTVDAYHGTVGGLSTIDPFRSNGPFGFHMSLGAAAGANARVGFPTSAADKVMQVLAGRQRSADAAVVPLKVRASRMLRMPHVTQLNYGHWHQPMAWVAAMKHPEYNGPASLRLFVANWIAQNGRVPQAAGGAVDHSFSRAIAAELSRLGYDAIVYKDTAQGVGRDSLMVWEPERVRSANDVFDERAAGDVGLMASAKYVDADLRRQLDRLLAGEPEETTDDVMASLIPRVIKQSVARTMNRFEVGERVDRLRVGIQDKFLPVRRIQEEKERQTGTKVAINLDTYVAEALFHGRAGEQTADLKTDYIEPLVEILRKADISKTQFDSYLYARHAQERNAEIAKINPGLTSGSGMTDAEANTILAAARGKQAAYDQAAKLVDAMIEETRTRLLRSGLISRETFDAWATKFANYVPLRGFEAGQDEADRPRSGRGFDIRGPEAMQALGRRSKADSPLAYALMQAQQAIIRSEKNRVDKTLYRFIQAYPDPQLYQIYRGEYRRRLNPVTKQVESYWVPPQFVRDDAIHGVKIGGKQYYMELKDPGLARAMRGVQGEQHNVVLRGMMWLSRTYASLLTSYNPEFVISNFMRDIQTALLNVTDVADKPAATRRKIIADAVSMKSIRGVLNALRGDGSADYARWFEEYRQAGGKISFMEFNDVERIQRDVTKSLERGRFSRVTRNAFKLVEDLNTAVENGVRLSTYIAMRNAGIGQDRAAFVARELTVNFNRKGEWSPVINSMYLFFNASVQGNVRMMQAIAKSRALQVGVASIMGAAFMLDWWNYMIAGDDDDGKNRWDKLESWKKERNLIIMTGRADGSYIQIPMPYGYNLFWLGAQQTGAVIRGAVKPHEAAVRVASSMLDVLSPIGGANIDGGKWTLAQMAAPTMVDPFIQVIENKNWYGGPIFPTKYNKNLPDSENAFSSVNPWFQSIARTLNSVTGGNTARKGAIDVSPEVLEHFFEFAGGGVAKFINNVATAGSRAINGEEWLPEKTPFVRRVYGKATTESRRRDFYTAWEEVDAAKFEIDNLIKNTRKGTAGVDEIATAREKHAVELQAYGFMRDTQRALSAMRKERTTIELNQALTRAQKEERLKEIQTRENGIILRSLGQLNRLKKQSKEQSPAAAPGSAGRPSVQQFSDTDADYAEVLQGVDRMGRYTPGPRASDMVEDRRGEEPYDPLPDAVDAADRMTTEYKGAMVRATKYGTQASEPMGRYAARQMVQSDRLRRGGPDIQPLPQSDDDDVVRLPR